MNLTFKTMLFTAALIFAAAQVQANVAINMDVEQLYSSPGVTVADNSLVVLLVNTNSSDTTWGDLTVGTAFSTNPNVIPLAEWGAIGGLLQNQADFSLSGGISADDRLMLLWFPNLTYSGSGGAVTITSPGFNQPFGSYRSDAATAFSDIGWKVPADAFAGTLAAIDSNNGGDLSPSLLVANQITAVPEPSTMALVGIGCLGALTLLRRKLSHK